MLQISTADTLTDLELRQQVDELINDGQFEAAEQNINSLLEKTADEPVLLNALGTIHARRQDFDKAEELLGKAIIRDPSFGDAHYNLGLVYGRQGRQGEAIEALLKAVELNPRDAAAHNDLGALYYAQGKSLLAKGHFIKALDASPQYKNAFINLFEIYWDNGETDKAVKLMKIFIQGIGQTESETAKPTAIFDVYRAMAFRPQGDPGFVPSPVDWNTSIGPRGNTSAEIDDLFLKRVPDELRHKKTGMNIAVVADFNIAGQLSLLLRLINRHTIHKARLIIMQGDYLSYDKDIILSDKNREDYQEALQIIRNADFYHVGRFPLNFSEVDWSKLLRSDNCVVQYYGSEIRHHAKPIYQWHKDNNILGISCWDYTMMKEAPLFYHVNIMCDTERVKPCSPPSDVIRICHPPTNRSFKKTDLFLKVMDELKEKYPVELELIEGKSNEECLELKSRCHITYDQISVGIYGLSAMESMAAGHAVLCGISNFAASYFPDNPIVYVHENNLKDRIEFLLQNKNEIVKAGQAGKAWVEENHNPQKIVRQICWLYDMARNGHRFAEKPDSFVLR